jgi:hypothetical protein
MLRPTTDRRGRTPEPTNAVHSHGRPGLDLAIEHTPEEWMAAGLELIEMVTAEGEEFTSFTLTERGLPDPPKPCQWGALFSQAQRLSLIEAVGYQVSRRPSRGGGACRVWRGTASPSVTEESAA